MLKFSVAMQTRFSVENWFQDFKESSYFKIDDPASPCTSFPIFDACLYKSNFNNLGKFAQFLIFLFIFFNIYSICWIRINSNRLKTAWILKCTSIRAKNPRLIFIKATLLERKLREYITIHF